MMIEPSHPFQRRQFDGLARLPGSTTMYQLCLVQTVGSLGQRIVVAVALTATRRLNTGLGQALAVANGNVLRASVTVANQGVITLWLAGVQRLFQGIQDEVGSHRTDDAPAHDAPGKDINHKGHIDKALPGRDVGEIGCPELIGALRLELAMNAIQRARCGRIDDGGLHDLAPYHAPQASAVQQAFDGAAGGLNAFAAQLAPDIRSAINLHIGLPDAFNLRGRHLVVLCPGTAQSWIAPLRGAPVAERGDLKDFANQLDPVRLAMLVDERSHYLKRRSSSAWAKNALTRRRISFALRSSLTSRSSALRRSLSTVVVPSRQPVSRSRWRTHRRNISEDQPILAAMDVMAAHCDSYLLQASWTMRTARSITSEEYRTDFFMAAPVSQLLEPPSNPGRFTNAIESEVTATSPLTYGNICATSLPSDTQTIQYLIDLAASYQNNLQYNYPSFITHQLAPGTYNSNSYAAAILGFSHLNWHLTEINGGTYPGASAPIPSTSLTAPNYRP